MATIRRPISSLPVVEVLENGLIPVLEFPGTENARAVAISAEDLTLELGELATEQAGIATAAAVTATTAKDNAVIAQEAAELAQTGAEAAEDNADDALEAFQALYLGSQDTDPVVDLNGNPVEAGAFYTNSGDNSLRIYNGVTWNAFTPTAVADFTDLGDVPNDYTGHNLKVLQVNAGATALEFGAVLGTMAAETAADYLTAAGIAAAYQPLDSDLTSIAALTTQAYGLSLLETANEAAFKALVNLEIGTDVQAAGNYKSQGRETFVIPGNAWVPTVTNGATRGVTELATNDIMSDTVDFDDASQDFATYDWFPPQKWDAGTVTFRYRWRVGQDDPGTSIRMNLSAVAISNDDAEDAALGTSVGVTDDLIAVNDHHISSESAAVTVAGTPAKADKVVFKLTRSVGHADDDFSHDVRIEAVEIFWTSNAATDTP